MSREKVTAEEKAEAAKACVEGRISQAEAARRVGVNKAAWPRSSCVILLLPPWRGRTESSKI